MLKKKFDWKELGIDLLVDLAAGMLGAVGIYNFALNANFPVAGFSGIAIILYHLFKIPVGAGMILLNIPVTIFCYKYLGKTFFLKSVKTTLIWSVLTDMWHRCFQCIMETGFLLHFVWVYYAESDLR